MVELDPKAILSGAVGAAKLVSDPRQAIKLLERAGDEAYFAALTIRSGMVTPELPHRIAQLLIGFERYGMLGGAIVAGGLRHGDRNAIIDERGELTYKELDRRSNALANAWRERGLEAGEGVAILVRNHRGFLDALFAGAKCGARVILLNTSFAGPQIREVAEREGTDLLVHDDEYSETLEDIEEPPRGRFRAWVDDPEDADDTLDALIDGADDSSPPGASEEAKITILTSGTTGTPKGASRSQPRSLGLLGGLLSKVPFRARQTTELCVPMFHALGFMQAMVAVGMGSTLVVRRRFDPEKTLESLDEHEADAMVVVPVMLRRILDVGEDKIKEHDLSSVKIIFVSGSALGAELAERAMKLFGPVVYNLYGSTEIAYATIATPEDLKADSSTAGKVVRGSVVKIYSEEGKELPVGESGRIFVGNVSQFEGYTGGGGKDEINGLMASGDVGHFDENGRLFIDGRDDEMIVSGGENVFPAEVEDMLARHESIQEAAAVGVHDEKFGQRLKAFVVLEDGAELSEDEIKKYVKENLANYKVPRDVVFIDELPRNQTGKVLKRQLLEETEVDGDEESSERDSSDEDSSDSSADRDSSAGASSADRDSSAGDSSPGDSSADRESSAGDSSAGDSSAGNSTKGSNGESRSSRENGKQEKERETEEAR